METPWFLDKFPMLGIFDYNLQTDRLLIFSAALGGNELQRIVKHFVRNIEQQDWLSQESRRLIARLICEIASAGGSGALEYEADFDGKGMRWKRLYYTATAASGGRAMRVIGLSTDIEEERLQVAAWKKMASEDAMTGLLNHESVSGQIAQSIRAHNGGTLMLLDIDDFKQINDAAGHLQGDLFLKQAADAIRSLFRDDDIVGRYGGDEFVVFLPGMKSVASARQRAEAINRAVSSIRIPLLEQTGCSIGIAVAESSAISLSTLFKQADFAMYEAKNSGKGHYVVIENGHVVHQPRDESAGLDTSADEQEADRFAGALFSLLCHAEDPHQGINDALAYVGRHLDVSRVYIFEQQGSRFIYSNTYEWCGEGVEPEIDTLQGLDIREKGMDFFTELDENDLRFCPDVDLIQDAAARELLRRQHIHSMLHWAFRKNGKLVGLIGFDECRSDRVWSTRYAHILRRAGEVISEYLLRVRSREAMRGLSEKALFDGLSNTSDNVYIFECDMKLGVSRWSDNALAYFGLPEDYADKTLTVWMEHIHPDDRDAYLSDIEPVFAGRKQRHYCQYRAKNAQGDYVWLECIGNVVPDEQGKPAFFVGLMTRLDHQSKFDPVTKCLSMEQFEQAELSAPCTLLLIGMDGFRQIVNSFGYEAGNDTLRDLADVLTQLTPDAAVYRMTGDEFLLLLPDGPVEAAQRFFRNILSAFQARCALRGHWQKLYFSGGAARYVPGGLDKATAIRRLEHSMEHAKSLGRGSFAFYSQSIEAKHTRLRQIKEALSRAIERDFAGFELYYQPIISSSSGTVHGVEGLLRFRDEELGMLSPEEFIPILEETRDIQRVGAWVMEEAVRQKAAWADRWPELCVGFNVSYLQLYSSDFASRLIEMVRRYGADPRYIVIELTESCRVEQPESLALLFRQLIDYGFQVLLDDFGMEHSSFTLVRDLPVSGIKIDHSFVRTLTGSQEDQRDRANLAIISSINHLCRHLNLDVIAEGVETDKIRRLLNDMGIDRLQGYYYSRPVPPAEVEKLFP